MSSGKRVYENWLKSYVEYTQFSEAPDVLHFWTGVAMIAGALRRRVWIEQRYFQWTPNFYIIFVAPPGIATKSTTVSIGLRLLRQVPGVKFGPDSVTWQRLIISLQEAQEMVPIEGKLYPMAPITCAISELGTFLKPDDADMVDVITDIWDGRVGVWTRELKTSQGSQIENPWLNIIGATTPAWLEKNFPVYLVGGGLTSRCVFVYAEHKKQLVAYPADAIDEATFESKANALVHDLREIARMAGEFRLTPEAKEFGTDWYERHWRDRKEHLDGDRFAGYMARKQTHIHKLAMVLSAAESNSLLIEQQHLEAASQIVTGLESDMQKVFQAVGAVDQSRQIKEIVAFAKIYRKITLPDLWRYCSTSMKKSDFKEALEGALEAGFVRMVRENNQAVILPAFTEPPPHEAPRHQDRGSSSAA